MVKTSMDDDNKNMFFNSVKFHKLIDLFTFHFKFQFKKKGSSKCHIGQLQYWNNFVSWAFQ